MFELLDDELYREVRKMIIACVLHGHVSHHFKMVSQMEVFYEVHSEGIRANTRRVNRGITVECIYVEPEDRLFTRVMLHRDASIHPSRVGAESLAVHLVEHLHLRDHLEMMRHVRVQHARDDHLAPRDKLVVQELEHVCLVRVFLLRARTRRRRRRVRDVRSRVSGLSRSRRRACASGLSRLPRVDKIVTGGTCGNSRRSVVVHRSSRSWC